MRTTIRHLNLLKALGLGAAAAALGIGAAQADVTISGKPTQNMSCAAGVCTATAPKAVLNISDLATMLAAGDAVVKTGSIAKDLVVKSSFSWTSASRLTLDAQRTVEIAKPLTVAGTGALTIATNDGGSNGEFLIDSKQSVQFWNLSSSLVIDGNSYTLVGDIKTLAADIAANPSGFYALAKPYDASGDGTYPSSPIGSSFAGIFEGLGNSVSNFNMNFTTAGGSEFGFFTQIASTGVVRNFGILNAKITGSGFPSGVGILGGDNEGSIVDCWAAGDISKTDFTDGIGGLVAVNGGNVSKSSTQVDIHSENGHYLGGLVSYNAGLISESFSNGRVNGARGFETIAGGLVGLNEAGDGEIADAYTLAKVHTGASDCCTYGGLVGENGLGATISRTYAAGQIMKSKSSEAALGGLIGNDLSAPHSVKSSYWDIDKGISDPSQGAGNIPNDPGITGLTTTEFQSGLPTGFDPKTWTEQPRKNGGLPYLVGTPLR